MRDTVPSPWFATHTVPSATATPLGCAPTTTGAPNTAPVVALMRVSSPSPALETHMYVPSNARPTGNVPTATGEPTVAFVAGSTRLTVPSRKLVAHTSDPSVASPSGEPPASTVPGRPRSRCQRSNDRSVVVIRDDVVKPATSASTFTGPPDA